MNRSDVTAVVEALEFIAINFETCASNLGMRGYGICTIVREVLIRSDQEFVKVHGILEYFWKNWEYYSGDKEYPVPSTKCRIPGWNTSSARAYCSSPNLYDLSTEYGKLRFDLVMYLIHEMNQYLDNLMEYDFYG